MKINFVLHLKTIATIVSIFVFICAFINVEWFRDFFMDVLGTMVVAWMLYALYMTVYLIYNEASKRRNRR